MTKGAHKPEGSPRGRPMAADSLMTVSATTGSVTCSSSMKPAARSGASHTRPVSSTSSQLVARRQVDLLRIRPDRPGAKSGARRADGGSRRSSDHDNRRRRPVRIMGRPHVVFFAAGKEDGSCPAMPVAGGPERRLDVTHGFGTMSRRTWPLLCVAAQGQKRPTRTNTPARRHRQRCRSTLSGWPVVRA